MKDTHSKLITDTLVKCKKYSAFSLRSRKMTSDIFVFTTTALHGTRNPNESSQKERIKACKLSLSIIAICIYKTVNNSPKLLELIQLSSTCTKYKLMHKIGGISVHPNNTLKQAVWKSIWEDSSITAALQGT